MKVLWLLGRTRTGKVANPDLAVRITAGTAFAPLVGGSDSVQQTVQENVKDLEVCGPSLLAGGLIKSIVHLRLQRECFVLEHSHLMFVRVSAT